MYPLHLGKFKILENSLIGLKVLNKIYAHTLLYGKWKLYVKQQRQTIYN